MRLIDADELLTDPYFQDESIPERELFIEAVEDSPTIDVMPKWISVDDDIPTNENDVLAWIGGKEIVIAWFDGYIGEWHAYGSYEGYVTHWMPLPEPPKEDAK